MSIIQPILYKQLPIKIDIPEIDLNEIRRVFKEKCRHDDQLYFAILFILNPIFICISNMYAFYNLYALGGFPKIYFISNLCIFLIYTPFSNSLYAKHEQSNNIGGGYLVNIIKIFSCVFIFLSLYVIYAFASDKENVYLMSGALVFFFWCESYKCERDSHWKYYIMNEYDKRYHLKAYDSESDSSPDSLPGSHLQTLHNSQKLHRLSPQLHTNKHLLHTRAPHVKHTSSLGNLSYSSL